MPIRLMIFSALLAALSLTLFLVEGLLPIPVLPPGAKLGLANIITVLALYSLPGWRWALLVITVRVMLSSLWSGGPTVLFYSIAGAYVSLLIMVLLKKSGRFSLMGVSAAGGFAHNAAQLAVASFIASTSGVWYYLPVLGPLGILCGLFTGAIANQVGKKLQRSGFRI